MGGSLDYLLGFSPHTWAVGAFVATTLVLLGAMLGFSPFLGGRSRGAAKHDAFESGVVSVGSGRLRISAQYYLVAMFFVIFDIEAVFLYAWSVSVVSVGWTGFVAVTVFVVVVLIALVYLWRLGGLDWSPPARSGNRDLPTLRRPVRVK